MPFIINSLFKIFLSTLSLRRATLHLDGLVRDAHISIHALLAESDQLLLDRGLTRDDISIHALLAESDVNFLIFDPSA